MPKLFLKVGRHSNPRVFAWDVSAAGTPTIDPRRNRMTAAEEGEFDFLLERGQHSCLGAGGQYEYRVYDMVEPPVYPYAIVLSDLQSVRDQYPNTCRVINLASGRESALSPNLEAARAVAANLRAGKGRGSFA